MGSYSAHHIQGEFCQVECDSPMSRNFQNRNSAHNSEERFLLGIQKKIREKEREDRSRKV